MSSLFHSKRVLFDLKISASEGEMDVVLIAANGLILPLGVVISVVLHLSVPIVRVSSTKYYGKPQSRMIGREKIVSVLETHAIMY